VQFSYKPDAKRELFEARDSMLQSDHIVANFAKVFGTAIDGCPCFSGEQLTERSLCALDLAGEDSLASDERSDENVRIGKASALTRQSANEAICFRQNSYEPRSPIEPRRQGGRQECRVGALRYFSPRDFDRFGHHQG
jgi:hypothetical protein